KLPTVPQAAFNAFERQDKPGCLEGTRVELLRLIDQWIFSDHESCVFWLNGVAGTGKSTIALTLCRELVKKGCLGASFFFSRNQNETSTARRFFTTIASLLALHFPQGLDTHIRKAIEARPDIQVLTLKDQWSVLIKEAMMKCDAGFQTIAIVVDALDECEEDGSIKAIISAFTEANLISNFKLRIVITSRPELPVRAGFHDSPPRLHNAFTLHHIPRNTVDADIAIYCCHRLAMIARGSSEPRRSWPPAGLVEKIVHLSAGLFIYASTVCLWVEEDETTDSQTSLEKIVRLFDGERPTTLMAGDTTILDQLYLEILEQAVIRTTGARRSMLCNCITKILGWILVLAHPIPLSALARLVREDLSSIKRWLERLHSLVRVLPVADGEIVLQFHHPSFRDFLLDQTRCTNEAFRIDWNQSHHELYRHSMDLLLTPDILHRDMCNARLPGTRASASTAAFLWKTVKPEVLYSCVNWPYHKLSSGKKLQDDDEDYKFLKINFLYWIETLSWIGWISRVVDQISSLIHMTDVILVRSFLVDARRFLVYNISIAAHVPLQIYASALVFAPSESIVRKTFHKHIPRWISILPQFNTNWTSELLIFEPHETPISAVCCSPKSTTVASASEDGIINIWNAQNGNVSYSFRGHRRHINCLCFSTDGLFLASASDDNTARVWSIDNGEMIHDLNGHSDKVQVVKFSPDGRQIASASRDRTMRLWDARSGEMTNVLQGHDAQFLTIDFSLDGASIMSDSSDDTVRIWDVKNGHQVQVLRKGQQGAGANIRQTWKARLSPDGRMVAAVLCPGLAALWDVRSGRTIKRFRDIGASMLAVCFSPDGTMLAIASWMAKVDIWNIQDGKRKKKLRFLPSFFSNTLNTLAVRITASRLMFPNIGRDCLALAEDVVSFSPDNKLVATASSNRGICIWNVLNGELVDVFKCEIMKAIAWSADGRLLISISYNQLAVVWELNT
ncbi:hypothetical protein K461DRAFT_217221, partial [Myriangium duriaei CBS 260.36]